MPPRHRVFALTLALLIGILWVSGAAATARHSIPSPDTPVHLTPAWTTGNISDYVGPAGMAVHDLDADGANEVLSCTSWGAYALRQQPDAAYAPVWYSQWLPWSRVVAGDRENDGRQEVFMATRSAQVLVFTLTSAAPIAQLTLDADKPIVDIAVANVDGDAMQELVIVRADATLVYNAATLRVKWQAQGKGGTQLGIGDVDGDEHVELVINGTPAYVLDPIRRVEQEQWPDGFGQHMALGQVDNDAQAEIVYVTRGSDDTLTVFDAATHTVQWRLGPTFNFAYVVATGDTDADGTDEIVVGSQPWGSVRGYRGTDGAELWEIKHPLAGVYGLAVGDADNDGTADIVWGGGLNSSGKHALAIGNWITRTLTWISDDLDGPLHVAAGDVDADGNAEIVLASTSTDSPLGGSGGPGMVYVYDGVTHRLEWAMRMPTGSWFDIYQLDLGQLDADPALEIVVGGGQSHEATVRVYDGRTHQLEHETANLAPISEIISAYQLVVANMDADPIDEVVVGLATGVVQVLDGPALAPAWTSEPLDSEIRSLSIGQIDGDGRPDIAVTTTYGLHLFTQPGWTKRVGVDFSRDGRPMNPVVGVVDTTSTTPGRLVVAIQAYGSNTTLVAFAADTVQPIWETILGQDHIHTIQADDVDGDGVQNVVFAGHYQATSTLAAPTLLLLAEPTAQGYKMTYQHAGSWGSINDVVVANVDNDAQREVVFSADTLIQVNDVTTNTRLQRVFLPQVQHAGR